MPRFTMIAERQALYGAPVEAATVTPGFVRIDDDRTLVLPDRPCR